MLHSISRRFSRHAPERRAASRGAQRACTTLLFVLLCAALCSVAAPAGVAHADAPRSGLPVDLPLNDALAYRAPEFTEGELQSLRNDFAELLRSPLVRGHSLSARIVALSTGQVVYSFNEDFALKPASNTKLFTTTAAWALLGESYRPYTAIYSDEEPVDGAINGDLVVYSYFDPSYSTHIHNDRAFVADRLIDQLEARGIRRIEGRVLIAGAPLIDGHRFGTLNLSTEREQATYLFQERLRSRDISVVGGYDTVGLDRPSDANTELARWQGPPLRTLVAWINRLSHNEFADLLLMNIGDIVEGEASYDAGFRAIDSWLQSIGIATDGLDLNDGSGLSHDNRVTANQLTTLIERVQRFPWADDWNESLSVAGVDGTFAGRLRSEATLGCAWMKSGTINGVITSAGILNHRGTGERFAIALLMNDVNNQPGARQIQDRIVERLASEALLAARPQTPELLEARLNNNDVVLRWDATSAERFVVERQTATTGWEPITLVDGESTSARVRAPREPAAWRVVALNSSGMSDPSVALLAGGPTNSRRVLVVEAHERWAGQPLDENGLGSPHHFLAMLIGPLAGYRVETVDNGVAVASAPPTNTDVLWLLGKEGADFVALTTGEQSWLRRAEREGSRVIVSGSEAAWDLSTREGDGSQFLAEFFGASFRADSAHTYTACAPDNEVCAFFNTPSGMRVDWPDALSVAEGGTSCLSYRGGTGNEACVQRGGAILLGFPLTAVAADSERHALLRYLMAL